MTNPLVHLRRGRSPGDDRQGGAAGRRRKGVSLVELALATPFLLVIMLGTIDLGRLMFDYIQLRSAVIEGATYGSRNPSNSGGITSEVTANSIPAGTSINVSVASGCLTTNGVGNVTVTASSVFTPITTSFMGSYWDIGSVNLSASSSMRCLT
jgi:Flp pilus assembly protein TadG